MDLIPSLVILNFVEGQFMNRSVIFILVPFLFAGDYVCHDNGTITGVRISVDSAQGCVKVDRATAQSITKYHKVEGEQVVEMSQVEKDALDAAEVKAIEDAKTAQVVSLENKLDGIKLADLTLSKVDTKIDAITSLAEAKTFLKLLVRGIIKLHGGL